MQKTDKIISAGWLLSSDMSKLHKNYSIVIQGNIIKDIIPTEKLKDKYKSSDHIRLDSHLVMPGLINGFINPDMILQKKKFQNNGNKDFKKLIHNNYYSNEYIKISSKLTACHMIKKGITTYCASSMYPEIAIDSAIDSGIRANVGLPISNRKNIWSANEKDCLSKCLEINDNYKGEPSIILSINIGSINKISNKMIQSISRIANELDMAIKVDMKQSEKEVKYFKNKYKCKPLKYYEEYDLLSNQFSIINYTNVENNDLAILRKSKVNIINSTTENILSNRKNNINELVQNKINVLLGTGDIIINPLIDLLHEVKTVCLLSRINNDPNNQISKDSILKMVSINGAKSLGIEKKSEN